MVKFCRLELRTTDAEAARAFYPKILAGSPSVGAIIDITELPGRHPHWLFFFEIDALEPAIAAMQTAGGLVLDPIALPSGERVCVCDDPEGAAFGLLERGH